MLTGGMLRPHLSIVNCIMCLFARVVRYNPLMFDANAFAGLWIGETMGHNSPAHVWEIKVVGSMLHIHTQWEGETTQMPIYGTLLTDEPAFKLESRMAVLIDSQHFVVAGWDTNDTRGNKGPAYDVVFSRPGIAELGAQEAYRRFKAMRKKSRAR